MARMAGVPRERAGWFTRLVYRIAERMVGRLPEPMTIEAHSPRVFQAVGAAEFLLDRAGRVPKGLKAMAQIKAAMQIGCPF